MKLSFFLEFQMGICFLRNENFFVFEIRQMLCFEFGKSQLLKSGILFHDFNKKNSLSLIDSFSQHIFWKLTKAILRDATSFDKAEIENLTSRRSKVQFALQLYLWWISTRVEYAHFLLRWSFPASINRQDVLNWLFDSFFPTAFKIIIPQLV